VERYGRIGVGRISVGRMSGGRVAVRLMGVKKSGVFVENISLYVSLAREGN
jgi:hypothetical protein